MPAVVEEESIIGLRRAEKSVNLANDFRGAFLGNKMDVITAKHPCIRVCKSIA